MIRFRCLIYIARDFFVKFRDAPVLGLNTTKWKKRFHLLNPGFSGNQVGNGIMLPKTLVMIA